MAKSVKSDLAQELYDAYGDKADWKNFQGNPMPVWKDLNAAVRANWQAVADKAAVTVREDVEAEFEPLNLTDQFDDRELERIRRSVEYVDAKDVTDAPADGKAALIAKMARYLNIE